MNQAAKLTNNDVGEVGDVGDIGNPLSYLTTNESREFIIIHNFMLINLQYLFHTFINFTNSWI